MPGMGPPTSTNKSLSDVVDRVKRADCVVPDDVSDMPQTGRIAVAGRPCDSNNSKNRRAVLLTIASPALMMNRSDDRSQRPAASSVACSLTKPKAKFGAHVIETRWRSTQSSQLSV